MVALVWKEFLQTVREWRALSLIFLTPTVFSLLMTWAVDHAQRSQTFQRAQAFRMAIPPSFLQDVSEEWANTLLEPFQVIPHEDPSRAVLNREVDVGLQPTPGGTLRVFFRSNDPRSMDAFQELNQDVDVVRQKDLERFLQHYRYRPPFYLDPKAVDEKASQQDIPWYRQIRRFSTRLIIYMAFVFLLMASMQVATDLSIGEKERGTMESLLATGASRMAIVSSKALISAVAGLTASGIVLGILRGMTLGQVSPLPWGKILSVWIFLIPIAFLSALSFLLVGSLASSIKEAQALNGMVLTVYFGAISLAALPLSLPVLPYLPVGSAAHFLNLFLAGFPVGWPLGITLWVHGGLAGLLLGALVWVYDRGWLWIR